MKKDAVLTLAKGDYLVREALTLCISQNISFDSNAVYFICGDNGLGKTTFLKKLLIPSIKQAGKMLFYVDQEFTLQFYAIKAHAAAHTEKRNINGFDVALKYFFDLFKTVSKDHELFFVFDEIEVYAQISDLFEHLAPVDKTIVMITHTPQTIDLIKNKHFITFSKHSAGKTCVEETLWADM